MEKGLAHLAGTGSRVSADRIQEKPLAGAGGGGRLDFAEADRIAKGRLSTKPTTYTPGHLAEETGAKIHPVVVDTDLNPRQLALVLEYIDREPAPFSRYQYDRKTDAEELKQFRNWVIRKHQLTKKLDKLK